MNVLLAIASVVLAVSAVLVVVRVTRGPTMLDRAISFDVLVAITMAAIAVDIAVNDSLEDVPILLVVTLLGFVGSVAIARFTPGSDTIDDEDDDEQADAGPPTGTDAAGGPGGRL